MKNSVYEHGESSHSKVETDNRESTKDELSYIVILDGSILHHCVRNGLSCVGIEDLFDGSLVEIHVTECTLKEMNLISQRYMGNDITESIVKAGLFTMLRCNHAQKNHSAESCIKAVLGINNHFGYYVATTAAPFLHELRLYNRNLVITANETEFFFLPLLENDAVAFEDEELVLDEEIRDLHLQRLHTRFKLHGFIETEVLGDGNCQFRAISHQLFHTEDRHLEVRLNIVDQLYTHPELYPLPPKPEERNIYLETLKINGTWGDVITLQAAADFYEVRISVVQSEPVMSFFELQPSTALHSLRFDRVIHLSYLQDEHYNSLYPETRDRRTMWGNSVNSHIWF